MVGVLLDRRTRGHEHREVGVPAEGDVHATTLATGVVAFEEQQRLGRVGDGEAEPPVRSPRGGHRRRGPRGSRSRRGPGCRRAPGSRSPGTAAPRQPGELVDATAGHHVGDVLLAAGRRLTQNAPDSSMRGQAREVLAGQKSTRGGSRETLVNDWQVRPTGSPSARPGHHGHAGREPAEGGAEVLRGDGVVDMTLLAGPELEAEVPLPGLDDPLAGRGLVGHAG